MQERSLRSLVQEPPVMPHSRALNLFIILVFIALKFTLLCAQDVPAEQYVYFSVLASKYGLACEEHDVVTEDGYIVKLFHISGDRTRPVLLMHGIIDSADTFLIRGNTSMVAVLSRAGYDVWVGNVRGNRYSRRHVKLDPNNDREYWNFSFHEIGIYDLPAKIDHILNHTGQTKLSCIGHSQGNTIFYVLGSMRPEYNEKIKLLIAMAPIAYLYHLPFPSKYVVQTWPIVSETLASMGQEEIFNDNSIERNLMKTMCNERDAYKICGYGIFFALAGPDPEELEPEFLSTVVAHYPAATSRKGGTHLLQLGLKRDFSQIDLGVSGNLVAYNSKVPPNYDLSKVTMNIALMAGANDKMCSLVDVRILSKRLPNVVEYYVLDWSRFNHIDFVWGRNMGKHLYPKILSLLQQFSNS